jgi:Flp pilus assembly pilin Flp
VVGRGPNTPIELRLSTAKYNEVIGVTMAKYKIPNLKKERGASMVEYALVVAFLAIVAFASIGSVGSQVNKKICAAGTELSDSVAGATTGGGDPCTVPLPENPL